MKKLLGLLIFAVVAFAASSPAQATCGGTAIHGGSFACYARAAGLWSNTTTVWSNTSGGAACSCTPASGDEVIFDGNTPAGTYTEDIGATVTIWALDASAAPAGVIIAGGTNISVSGIYWVLSAAMTWSNSANWTFTNTGGGTVVIQTGGHALSSSNVTFNGVAGGSFVVGGDASNTFSDGANILTLTAGTLDFATHNPNVTTGTLVASGSTTRTLNCGTGTFTLSGTSIVLNTSGSALTLSCASATLNATAVKTGSQTRTISILGGQSFGTLTFTPPATPIQGYDTLTIGGAGAATIATLNLTGPENFYISFGSTLTLTNAPTWTGTSTGLVNVQGTASAVVTITVTNGAPALNWVALWDVAFVGSLGTATNSFNLGASAGNLTITPPSTGGGRIIGG